MLYKILNGAASGWTAGLPENESLSFRKRLPNRSEAMKMECPAFYVPVLMRETGRKGADDGEGQEAYT